MADVGNSPTASGGHDAASPRISLRASVTHVDTVSFKIHFTVQNEESSPIFVLDRLWMLNVESRAVPDPARAYRYVRDTTLRVLLGNAPLPRFKHALYRNVPNATPVQPGRSLEGQIELPVPAPEYSPYFKGEKTSDYTDVTLNALELFVDYIPAGPDVVTEPSPYDPTALSFDTPGVWQKARRLRSGLLPASFHALKRTDSFDRLVLPDESPGPP